MYQMDMHAMQIVYQIAYLYQIRLMRELVFVGFHGLSSTKHLFPSKGEADTLLRSNAWNVCQLDTLIILHFFLNVKLF